MVVVHYISDDNAECLGLDQPFFYIFRTLLARGSGRIWHKQEGLAEGSWLGFFQLSIFDIAIDGYQDGHVLSRLCWPCLGPFQSVIWVDSLAVVALDLIMWLGHLLLEYCLHCCCSGNLGAVEAY